MIKVNEDLKLKFALIIMSECPELLPYAEHKLMELGEIPTDDKLAGFVLGYLTAVCAAKEYIDKKETGLASIDSMMENMVKTIVEVNKRVGIPQDTKISIEDLQFKVVYEIEGKQQYLYLNFIHHL